MNIERNEPPLTVPVEFERAHLAESRRIVARSHRRPLVRSRAGAPSPSSPQVRARRAAVAAHAFGLLLVLLLATLTGTWGIAAAMAGVIGVSLLVVLRILAVMTGPAPQAGAAAQLRTDRPG